MKPKVVVITGASSGLGEALARACTKEGWKVYATARSEDKIKQLAKKIGCKSMKLDVTNYSELQNVVRKIAKQEGSIDVWINNAGGEHVADLTELKKDLFEEIVAVNFSGVVYSFLEVPRYMKEGDFVQILSSSAYTPREKEPAYASAKAAAAMFAESVRPTLQKKGIRVLNFYPGGMDTPFAQKAGLPLHKNALSPQEVATLIVSALKLPRNMAVDTKIMRNA